MSAEHSGSAQVDAFVRPERKARLRSLLASAKGRAKLRVGLAHFRSRRRSRWSWGAASVHSSPAFPDGWRTSRARMPVRVSFSTTLANEPFHRTSASGLPYGSSPWQALLGSAIIAHGEPPPSPVCAHVLVRLARVGDMDHARTQACYSVRVRRGMVVYPVRHAAPGPWAPAVSAVDRVARNLEHRCPASPWWRNYGCSMGGVLVLRAGHVRARTTGLLHAAGGAARPRVAIGIRSRHS